METPSRLFASFPLTWGPGAAQTPNCVSYTYQRPRNRTPFGYAARDLGCGMGDGPGEWAISDHTARSCPSGGHAGAIALLPLRVEERHLRRLSLIHISEPTRPY